MRYSLITVSLKTARTHYRTVCIHHNESGYTQIMTLKSKILIIATSLITVVFLSSLFLFKWDSNPTLPAEEAKEHLADSAMDLPEIPVEEEFPYEIRRQSTFFNALRDLNIPPVTIQEIVDATKPVYNLARLQSGIRFQLFYSPLVETELMSLQFYFSPLEKLLIEKKTGQWVAQKITENVTIETVTFSGTVTSSLWESAVKAGMDPDLISELADIFGWEVDFAREVQVNDKWRLSVEQKKVKNKAVGWGSILAAEYINVGTTHQAALFRKNGENLGYYTPKGESLRKVFLKSPIRYGRITSGFKRRRFHPVLQIYRAHRGVDYGAPIGTPVRSVGDGTVIFAARSGGGGNVIKIRHNSIYQTAYKHLHGFGKGIRSGARVQQGQVIGYVGNTGLSTGPHLHFEFYQSGSYIDPLGKKFPSADPVPTEDLSLFQAQAQSLLSTLPSWNSANPYTKDQRAQLDMPWTLTL